MLSRHLSYRRVYGKKKYKVKARAIQEYERQLRHVHRTQVGCLCKLIRKHIALADTSIHMSTKYADKSIGCNCT